HSGSLALQGGLDDEKLRRQHAELAEVMAGRYDITVLRGMEVDVLKDGSLDVTDEQLANLDVVLVSVHSFFELPEAQQTERVVRALLHPRVNVYAHPLGRQLGQRDPIALDLEAVFAACRENRVAVEHNASPRRLDLPDVHLRAAAQAGLKVFIGTDAHSVRGLGAMGLGVSQARRAWLTADDVVNTRPLAEVLAFLARGGGGAARALRPAPAGARGSWPPPSRSRRWRRRSRPPPGRRRCPAPRCARSPASTRRRAAPSTRRTAPAATA